MLRAGSQASSPTTGSWPLRQRPPPLVGCRRAIECRAAGFPPPPPNPPPNASTGFRLLEKANALLPQGALVTTARTGWRLAWQAMVRELAPQRKDGQYVRPGYAFADRISAADAEQATAAATATATAGASSSSLRFVLYVGNACPWCHRVLLTLALREMRSLVRVIDLLDDPEKATRGGWIVAAANAPEPVFGARDLFGVYDAASPGFRGRCTAPLLVDACARRAVCNESAELVRNLVELRPAGVAEASSKRWANQANLLPEAHLPEIERLNTLIYENLANGVYRAGFATSQQAFEDALEGVRSTLAELEARLATQRFLCGEVLTEADVRLFPALCRLDAVYHPFFLRGAPLRVSGGGQGGAVVGGLAAVFPSLHAYLNDIWELPGVRQTIDVSAARLSYWRNLFPLNPGGIVPPGPSEEDVRRGAQGESGAEVAARRRRAFGGGGGDAPRSAEEVCARF